MPSRAKEAWADFVRLFELLQGAPAWPADVETARLWYGPHLDRRHDDAAMRMADLVQLVRIAHGYASRTSFITELTLDPPQATSDLASGYGRDEEPLVRSTIHSAKGQEWRVVVVLNCVDGCIPSDRATGSTEQLEEERRLFYVAMTRAKDALHLLAPVRFYAGAQSVRAERQTLSTRSRFLPPHVLDQFEQPSWKPRQGEAGTVRPVPPRDLKASVRGMWA